jgi:RecB family endonuclease NucS
VDGERLMAIRKALSGWVFGSEALLEDFVWSNLQPLFGLTPLKRQYYCNNEVSDILAIDDRGGLVILELKNVEDRYLIQQLTRYYANLLEEKPFSQEIDYSLPPRLIAIAPNYHRHNLIDKNHSRLDFELFRFSITGDETLEFVLEEQCDIEGVQNPIPKKCAILDRLIEVSQLENTADSPDLLIKWLGNCSIEEQQGFMDARNKILACHPKMNEMVGKRSIQYGSGKTKLCAEIGFHQTLQKPILFLWLPIPSAGFINIEKEKPLIGRLRIWTDGQAISHVGHIPEGFGKMKTRSEWEEIPLEKRPRKSGDFSFTSRSSIPVSIQAYIRHQSDEEKMNLWDVLSSLAIKTWLEKT